MADKHQATCKRACIQLTRDIVKKLSRHQILELHIMRPSMANKHHEYLAQPAFAHTKILQALCYFCGVMSLCTFAGNADMYGLGIRLGYYLQWYGGIFASLLAPEEVPGARFALGLFISATFLALVIQTVKHRLYEVEIYIILLLTFGAYLFIVPWLLWRLVTGCQPLLDPSRFPLVDPGPTHSDLHSLLILAVTGYQLWFWFVRVPDLDRMSCRFYGFAFAKVPLNNRAFQVINIVLYFVLGVAVLVLFTLRLNSLAKGDENKRRRAAQWEREKQRLGKQGLSDRVTALQQLNLVNNFTTASIVVVATELTIKWNHVTGVNTLSSAGQLIPFVIGLGVVVRVLYVWLKPKPRPPRKEKPPLHSPHRPYELPVYAMPPRFIVDEPSTIKRDPPIPPPLPDYAIPPPMSYAPPPKRSPRPRRPSRSSPGSRYLPRRSTVRQHQVLTSYDTAQSSPPAPVPSHRLPAMNFARPETISRYHRSPEASANSSRSTLPHLNE
jgi:hypothetical protein